MKLFLKKILLQIFIVTLSLLSCVKGQYDSIEENEQGNCKNATSRLSGKPYERYSVNCCKDTSIGKTSSYSLYDSIGDSPESKCFKTAHPNDDLPTTMWKQSACKWKIWTNTTEAEFSFKTVVNYLTKDYSNSTGVQQLIRDANTECPDGDKADEFHVRLQGYLNCFYSNEQKTCNNPTPEGVKEMNELISSVKNATIQSPFTCPSMPGTWYEELYCCAGKQTPETWWRYNPEVLELHSDSTERQKIDPTHELPRRCQKSINDILFAEEHSKVLAQNEGTSNAEDGEKSDSETSSDYDQGHHYLNHRDCFTACDRNTVVYTNDSSVPELKFDFKKEVDRYFPNQAVKVQKELKEIVLRNKNSFKVSVTMSYFDNQTYLTLEEIETQYSSLESAGMRIGYYCAYYEGIERLIFNSHFGICVSDEAFVHRLDPGTPPINRY